MRSVPSNRADGCSDGISACTCTVAGSTRPMRLTAAFTAAHARRCPCGTQGGHVGSKRPTPVDGAHAAAHARRLARHQPVEHRAVVRRAGEEAPAVVEAADHEAAHRRAVAVVQHRVGLDRRRTRRLARQLGRRLRRRAPPGAARDRRARTGRPSARRAVDADRVLGQVPAERRDEPDRSRAARAAAPSSRRWRACCSCCPDRRSTAGRR